MFDPTRIYLKVWEIKENFKKGWEIGWENQKRYAIKHISFVIHYRSIDIRNRLEYNQPFFEKRH